MPTTKLWVHDGFRVTRWIRPSYWQTLCGLVLPSIDRPDCLELNCAATLAIEVA